MPTATPYARTIVEAELVVQRIEKACRRAPRLREMYEFGILWKIARRPTSGTRIDDSKYYAAKTYSWAPGGVPTITVLYWFDDGHVYIESSKIDWPNPKLKRLTRAKS